MARDQENQRERRVDIGGYELRIRVVGEGDPTVVFDSGLGDRLESWDRVQPEVARQARTVSYDRAGIGQSDTGPQPRSVTRMVDELHRLLRGADLRPPYVLVGHSMAGFNIRLFADECPDEVVGLVFVDASHEDLWSRWEALRTPEDWSQFQRKMEGFYRDTPEGIRAEWDHFHQNAALIQCVDLPSDVPTVILTSIRLDADMEALDFTATDVEAKLELRREWVRQAPQATHIVSEASGHYIQQDEPELVIDAIREVLRAVEVGSRSVKA